MWARFATLTMTDVRVPDTKAPALVLSGVGAVIAGEVVFRATVHSVPHGCSEVSAYSPWVPWLVALGAVLSTAGLILAFLHAGSLRVERRSWRRATVAVSLLTLLCAAVALLWMWGASTFEICF